MALNYLGEAFHTVGPDTNSLISGSRYDCVAIWSYAHAVDWSFVSNEAERPHHWLKVPDHYSAVERAGNDLSEVGVETSRRGTIFVALERTLEGGVGHCFLRTSRLASDRALGSLMLMS